MTLATGHVHSPNRTLADQASQWWMSAAILTIVFVSFRPFTSSDVNEPGQQSASGDIVNQLGFGVLGIICAYIMANKVPKDVVRAMHHPLWTILMPILALSVWNADVPASAMRAMLFSMVVVLAAATALGLLRNLSDLVSTLAVTSAASIALSYLAVFAFPAQGVHDGSGFEAFHSGLWRGIYDHKNVAAYVLGSFALFGWFVSRNGRPLTGLLIAAAATAFVVQAGSKTVLVILPAAIFLAMLAQWISWRPLKVLVLILPLAVLATVTLGAVVYPPVLDQIHYYFPGQTYTGRTDIWIFGLNSLADSPIWGYGFESFWNTPRVANMVQPIDLGWDVRGIVHGHNSWLDAALAFGIPGTIVLGLVLVVLPLVDYCRIPNSGNSGKLAGLFITIWVFTAMGASLESFFFRRADPVWFCMLISVIGLRLTAHLSNQHNRAPMGR